MQCAYAALHRGGVRAVIHILLLVLAVMGPSIVLVVLAFCALYSVVLVPEYPFHRSQASNGCDRGSRVTVQKRERGRRAARAITLIIINIIIIIVIIIIYIHIYLS